MKHPKPEPAGKGEESVWDYPRPPRLEKESKHLKVIHKDVVLASTNKGYRVLETSHPPNYYFPPDDVDKSLLIPSEKQTWCEWKGKGKYYHVKVENQLLENVAWYYDNPNNRFEDIKNYIAFYPAFFDQCLVNDEKVIAQPGGFYGGWITSEIKGPFKGIEGSWGW